MQRTKLWQRTVGRLKQFRSLQIGEEDAYEDASWDAYWDAYEFSGIKRKTRRC